MRAESRSKKAEFLWPWVWLKEGEQLSQSQSTPILRKMTRKSRYLDWDVVRRPETKWNTGVYTAKSEAVKEKKKQKYFYYIYAWVM